MKNTTHGTNGKSTIIHTSQVPATLSSVRPTIVPELTRFSRLLDLVRDAVDLELRLKVTMAELDKELREAGTSELPSVLVSLLRNQQPQPVIVTPASPGPTVKKTVTSPRRQSLLKGGAWKARIMGLLSDGKTRKSIDIVKELKAKNPTTVYTILCELVKEGSLVRVKYAHYRLKMRGW